MGAFSNRYPINAEDDFPAPITRIFFIDMFFYCQLIWVKWKFKSKNSNWWLEFEHCNSTIKLSIDSSSI